MDQQFHHFNRTVVNAIVLLLIWNSLQTPQTSSSGMACRLSPVKTAPVPLCGRGPDGARHTVEAAAIRGPIALLASPGTANRGSAPLLSMRELKQIRINGEA